MKYAEILMKFLRKFDEIFKKFWWNFDFDEIIIRFL